jgi:hypothetical protein
MLGQDRLDTLADPLGVSRLPGGPLSAFWHWTSIAPACSVGTPVCVSCPIPSGSELRHLLLAPER